MCHWAEIKHVCVKGKISTIHVVRERISPDCFAWFTCLHFFFFLVKCVILVERCLLIHLIPANFSFIVKQPNVFAKMFYFYLQFNTRLIFRIIVIKCWFLNLWNFTPLFLMEGNFSHSSKSYLSFPNVVVYFDNHFVKIYTCNCFIPDQQ